MGGNPKIVGFYPPKWMVKIMENPIKMDDFGVFPLFLVQHPYVLLAMYQDEMGKDKAPERLSVR